MSASATQDGHNNHQYRVDNLFCSRPSHLQGMLWHPLYPPSYFSKDCPAWGLSLHCQPWVWLTPEFLTKCEWFKRSPISNDVILVITYLQNCEIGPWLMNINRPIRYTERKIGPLFSVCGLKHWSGTVAERAKNPVSGCEKIGCSGRSGSGEQESQK